MGRVRAVEDNAADTAIAGEHADNRKSTSTGNPSRAEALLEMMLSRSRTAVRRMIWLIANMVISLLAPG